MADNINDHDPVGTGSDQIHVRLQMRNGVKAFTHVQGLPKEVSVQKVLTVLKKELRCNGNLATDSQGGADIVLHGDHREYVRRFLTDQGIADASAITVH
ncbi:hypothetical protein [Streptomyces sp. NPDC001717]|uniref:hypothetical protein n=1 Tax=Streptomyces sp. NPDC001717 TaxID=3364604 RepID=UPI0036843BA5